MAVEGIGEAAPVVGLRMVSTMRIYGRGRGVRSYSGGWVKMVSMMQICGRGRAVRSFSGGWVKGGVDDADLRPWTGRQKLLW